MEGLTVGRNVHYVEDDGTHSAAIVTNLHQGTTVDLYVMRAGSVIDNRPVAQVSYSEEPKPNTWHWIEKA